MDMTGMKFDLNPESFTLQNMFAMELHKFSDVIGDITASATKELGIEKGIAEVADAWNTMKFTVIKYMKGTQERGFVLGTVDEILQILDDNAMNLQSMSASRFVGPFLDTVQKWEKSLSHIGEVVEVRRQTDGNTLFCRALTSIFSQRLLHKMTRLKQFS